MPHTNKRLLEKALRCPRERLLASEIEGGLTPVRTDPNRLTRQLIEVWAPYAAAGKIAYAEEQARKAYEQAATIGGLACDDPEVNLVDLHHGQSDLVVAALYMVYWRWARAREAGSKLVPVPASHLRVQVSPGLWWHNSPLLLAEGVVELFRPVSTWREDDAEEIHRDLSRWGELEAAAKIGAVGVVCCHPVVIGIRKGAEQNSPLTRPYQDAAGTLYWTGGGRKMSRVQLEPADLMEWTERLARNDEALEAIFPVPMKAWPTRLEIEQWWQTVIGIEDLELPAHHQNKPLLQIADKYFPRNYRECTIRGRCDYYDLCWGQATINDFNRGGWPPPEVTL